MGWISEIDPLTYWVKVIRGIATHNRIYNKLQDQSERPKARNAKLKLEIKS